MTRYDSPPYADGIRFVDPGLLVEGEGSLRGASCASCETATFPVQQNCPKCGQHAMSPVALPRTGELWSFTIQNFQPKTPFRPNGDFEPYGVGYIDLGSVIVESRLVENRPEDLAIGDRMRLCFVPVFRDADGAEVFTFAFGKDRS